MDSDPLVRDYVGRLEAAAADLGWLPTADLTRIVSDAWDFHRSIEKAGS